LKQIVFVTGVLSNGGAERVISVLASKLVELDYKVDIITIYGDKNDYIKNQKVNINPIRCRSKNKFFRVFETIIRLRAILKKKKPDLVISFVAIINMYTILSSLLFMKTKLIVSERNDPYQNPENKYLRKLRDVLYRFSDGFVFQTEDAKKYFSLIVQRKGTVIPNPVTSNLPYWDRFNHEKTIITASRLVEQKNIPMMIDAFVKLKKDYPEYKLKIFGIGNMREELLEYIKSLGMENEIYLPGFSTNIHHEMAKSSLFVLSSNYEGISNAMLEALAIGVPVVTTDSPIGGARMFIKNNKNGLLTRVGDTDQFYNAMKKVISDKKFAFSLSEESIKIREQLSTEVIVEKWQQYIYIVCEDKNAN
jgi:GalNAc-alpha-(1->4)-GalNAc-alpha-(1->3)-diNAcBac-PP-undecaprenol alpha-1,4-N-acetyl-D-galactosaminyltransferase